MLLRRRFTRGCSCRAALPSPPRPTPALSDVSVKKGGARGIGSEPLERRTLLASIAWDGGGDGVNWSDARNWSSDQLPASADDVTVATAAGVTVQIVGTQATRSLVASSPLRLTGGTLSVTTTADISADFTLAGGTLVGAAVATNGAAKAR